MRSVTGTDSPLRVLDAAKPLYELPDPSVVREVLTPAISACERFDLMAGYFSGAVLAEMAHGLASYLTRTTEPLRLLVGPVLTDQDHDAIREGSSPESVASAALEAAFNDVVALESALAHHTKRCLAYLLGTGRLQMKVVVMRDGIFHPKQWTFAAGDDVAVLAGSANATLHAVTVNAEQLRLDRNWREQDAQTACVAAQEFFDAYWNNRRTPLAVSVPVSEALSRKLLQRYGEERPPTENEYNAALRAEGLEALSVQPTVSGIAIPRSLEWETGPYSHQGDAVRAWEANDGRGVLAIATGGGKTICSLVAAARMASRTGRLFILVAAPTKPLVAQWADEMRVFGLSPYVQSGGRRSDAHASEISIRMSAVERGIAGVDSAVITHDLLNNSALRKVLSKYSADVLLIGDEAHNLGAEGFIGNPPEVRYRLGLSATPERQYDPAGTNRLFEYFGGVVYEFGLDRAIGLCLVPYDYFVHDAHLQASEMDEYRKLSNEIRLMYARLGSAATDDSRLQIKLQKRRRLLEDAASKIDVLRACLEDVDLESLQHCLVYVTDKNPEQLVLVNRLLRELGVRFHQLTQQETRDGRLVKEIVDRFRSGQIQVLTAKRVLDEGVNIPEIQTAYLLASTTVERQWTQRRGRILRQCKVTKKSTATLHDIVALPPISDGLDDDVRRLVKGELLRVEEFAGLSRNKHSRNGAYAWCQRAAEEYRVVMD